LKPQVLLNSTTIEIAKALAIVISYPSLYDIGQWQPPTHISFFNLSNATSF
jgi:hypothetical protein